MEKKFSGTLAIDLGNTNTVVAFQDQKNTNPILVEIPKITSFPGVIPTAVWFEETSKISKKNVINQGLQKKLYPVQKRLVLKPIFLLTILLSMEKNCQFILQILY